MSLPELSRDEILRYSRHLLIPEVGLEGQRKLKNSSVLIIGTGGLGSPLALYLAAAGIGLWPQGIAGEVGPEGLVRYGYDPDAPQDKVITAFQRHFRPAKLDGKWDSECAGLLASLIRQAGV